MERFNVKEEYKQLFIQIPVQFYMIESKYYKMSDKSKILYGILFRRNNLSKMNKWLDENGDIYFIATVEDIMKITNWGNKTVIKILKELREYKLLESVQKGRGNPNIHYLGKVEIEDVILKEFKQNEFVENEENSLETFENTKKCQKYTSRSVKSTLLEVSKVHTNNIYNKYINNNNNNNLSIYHSNNNIDKKNRGIKEKFNTPIKEKFNTSIKKNKEIDGLMDKIEKVKEITFNGFTNYQMKKFIILAEGDVELFESVYENILLLQQDNSKKPITNLVTYLYKSIENEVANNKKS